MKGFPKASAPTVASMRKSVNLLTWTPITGIMLIIMDRLMKNLMNSLVDKCFYRRVICFPSVYITTRLWYDFPLMSMFFV